MFATCWVPTVIQGVCLHLHWKKKDDHIWADSKPTWYKPQSLSWRPGRGGGQGARWIETFGSNSLFPCFLCISFRIFHAWLKFYSLLFFFLLETMSNREGSFREKRSSVSLRMTRLPRYVLTVAGAHLTLPSPALPWFLWILPSFISHASDCFDFWGEALVFSPGWVAAPCSLPQPLKCWFMVWVTIPGLGCDIFFFFFFWMMMVSVDGTEYPSFPQRMFSVLFPSFTTGWACVPFSGKGRVCSWRPGVSRLWITTVIP